MQKSCRNTTIQSVSYFINPSYPSTDNLNSVCDYSVDVYNPNVCQIRSEIFIVYFLQSILSNYEFWRTALFSLLSGLFIYCVNCYSLLKPFRIFVARFFNCIVYSLSCSLNFHTLFFWLFPILAKINPGWTSSNFPLADQWEVACATRTRYSSLARTSTLMWQSFAEF